MVFFSVYLFRKNCPFIFQIFYFMEILLAHSTFKMPSPRMYICHQASAAFCSIQIDLKQNLKGTRMGRRERNFDIAWCNKGCNKGTNERKIKVRSDLERLPCCTTINQGALWRDIFQCNFVCESQRWTRMWTN